MYSVMVVGFYLQYTPVQDINVHFRKCLLISLVSEDLFVIGQSRYPKLVYAVQHTSSWGIEVAETYGHGKWKFTVRKCDGMENFVQCNQTIRAWVSATFLSGAHFSESAKWAPLKKIVSASAKRVLFSALLDSSLPLNLFINPQFSVNYIV